MILDNVDDDNIFFHQDAGKVLLIASIPQTENGSVIVTSRSVTATMSLIGTYENIIHADRMRKTLCACLGLKLLSTKLLYMM